MLLGLIGELYFIKRTLDQGEERIINIWNGPIRSSQDFQGKNVAVEIKTSCVNELHHVHISSELQLDNSDREDLFLVVYRTERNDSAGIRIGPLVKEIADGLHPAEQRRFYACLYCLGYKPEDEKLYEKGYIFKESRAYRVKDDFPRLLKTNLPKEISDVSYKLSLSNCEKYIVNSEVLFKCLKEQEYGEE